MQTQRQQAVVETAEETEIQAQLFAAPTVEDVRLLEMVNEVEREIGYRQGVYGRLVSSGKMNPVEADRRILVMQAVLRRLYQDLERENAGLDVIPRR